MVKIKAMKPGPPKAKKTTPLKAKMTKKALSPKAKVVASPKFIALKKKDDGEFRKKTLQKRKFIQQGEAEKRGVIVLSNIPHGFFESQMKRYFRQFGVVEKVRLVRSKKSGQSCGFAYVEFQHYEVAKIVAKHMDGYLTFGKIMKCRLVPPSVVSNQLFKGINIRPNNCPKLTIRKGAIRKLNKQRTEKQIERRTSRLKSTYSKKIKKLQELGIEIPLQTLLGTQQKSEVAVEGEAKNTEPSDAPVKEEEEEEECVMVSEDESDGKPSKAILDLTKEQKEELVAVREELAAKIMKNLEAARKAKARSKKQAMNGEEMVLEVDASDDEVVLKTPPNAIKKYVKMGADSTTGTPKSGKGTPKSGKGTPKSAKLTLKSGKLTPKSARGTPKSAKLTPKSAKLTPKSAKGTPKLAKGTPKSAKIKAKSAGEKTPSPKPAKGTPKAERAPPVGMNDKTNATETLQATQTPKMTPPGKKKTPKAGKTPKIAEVTPKSDTPKPKAKNKTPKAAKTTPKMPKVNLELDTSTPEAKTPSKAKNKTPKAAKTPPRVPEVTLNLDTPKLEAKTPSKAKNKTPKTAKTTPSLIDETLQLGTPKTPSKAKKKTPKAKNSTSKELMNGGTHITPKKSTSPTPTPKIILTEGTNTPNNKKGMLENIQDTPTSKKGTPKAKKTGETGAWAVMDLSPAAGKLTPRIKTPKATPVSTKALTSTAEATPGKKKKKGGTNLTPRTPEVTPGKRKQVEDVAGVTEATPIKKKKSTPGKTPKMTPGKSTKLSEDMTGITEVTPNKKKSKKTTPGKTMTPKLTPGKTPKVTPGKSTKLSEDMTGITEVTPNKKKSKKTTPGKTMTPKLTPRKTPKVSPGKRKTPKHTPDGKSHFKKLKVLKES